ncbi:MAG: ABC transporter permease [Bacillota bacterium]
MTRYVVVRLSQLVVVVLLALTVVFFLQFLAGDPVALHLPLDATREEIEAMRERLGLLDPLPVQYFRFLSRVVQGDFGSSLRHTGGALPTVLSRVPATAQLAALGIVVSLGIAIPVGVVSAANRESVFDRLGIVVTVLGQAIPGFWLGLMAMLVFSVRLGWLPTGGRGGLEHLILPTITLTAFYAARFARLSRSTMLDVLSTEYIRTARAKGLSERVVLYKHGLRNASISILTLVGLQLVQLLGGAVVTETIFYWPGLGRLMLQSLLYRDFSVVFAGVSLIAIAAAVMNLLVDLAYAWVDPRVRYS